MKRLRLWATNSELPPNAFKGWCKPDLAISPAAVICTVDSDGPPRSAPFGSLRAITPKVMRLCSWHGHETYLNLKRDALVPIALISPEVPVSVLGHARVVRPTMEYDPTFATVDIDVELAKNDMVYRIVIESGIEMWAKERNQQWYDGAMAELDGVE